MVEGLGAAGAGADLELHVDCELDGSGSEFGSQEVVIKKATGAMRYATLDDARVSARCARPSLTLFDDVVVLVIDELVVGRPGRGREHGDRLVAPHRHRGRDVRVLDHLEWPLGTGRHSVRR